jgi:hypothetical protein
MYKVKEIIPYELTRDVVLQNSVGKPIEVFDDSDLLGNNDFDFLKVGYSYNCKIGILGDIEKNGRSFHVEGREMIGNTVFTKLSDENGDIFYLEPDGPVLKELGQTVKVDVERYDLLQVDDVIHSRYI